MPDELWLEVCDIVQESRPPPRKRNVKKAKQVFEEALQIPVKRREVKSKEKRKDIPI